MQRFENHYFLRVRRVNEAKKTGTYAILVAAVNADPPREVAIPTPDSARVRAWPAPSLKTVYPFPPMPTSDSISQANEK